MYIYAARKRLLYPPQATYPVPGVVYLPLTILLVYVWYMKYTSIVCMVDEVHQYEEGQLDH